MSGLFDSLPFTPDRVLCWFSCGAPSAVAAKLTLAEYPDAKIVRILLDGEHEDGNRFAADVSRWLGQPIVEIRSHRYRDHFQVVIGERYINGPYGAKCTAMLKRDVRNRYQRGGDLHVFGFDGGRIRSRGRLPRELPGPRDACPGG